MKRNILKITFIAAVAVAAGYTAYSQLQKAETLSDLTLQNIEALANGEDGSECRWKRASDEHGCTVHYCVLRGDGNLCSCGAEAY